MRPKKDYSKRARKPLTTIAQNVQGDDEKLSGRVVGRGHLARTELFINHSKSAIGRDQRTRVPNDRLVPKK